MRYQSVDYTSFKRPASISENNYTAAFTYNGNEERVKMELKKSSAKELTRYYLSGCYEIDDPAVGNSKEKLYLGGDFYTAAAVYVKSSSGSWQLYYICRDYLGSITHITSATGSLYYQYSYDAWGRLRNPTTQTVYEQGSEPIAVRLSVFSEFNFLYYTQILFFRERPPPRISCLRIVMGQPIFIFLSFRLS